MCVGQFAQAAASPFVAEQNYKQALAHNLGVKYQQTILQQNAMLADEDAHRIEVAGHANESEALAQVRSIIGIQKSAAASAGVLATSGSVAEAQGTTVARGLSVADMIARKARRDAIQMRMQAMQYRMQARMVGTTKVSTGWAIASALVGGAAKAGEGAGTLMSMGSGSVDASSTVG